MREHDVRLLGNRSLLNVNEDCPISHNNTVIALLSNDGIGVKVREHDVWLLGNRSLLNVNEDYPISHNNTVIALLNNHVILFRHTFQNT